MAVTHSLKRLSRFESCHLDHGLIVVMVTHFFCKEELGVRIPFGPLAVGLRLKDTQIDTGKCGGRVPSRQQNIAWGRGLTGKHLLCKEIYDGFESLRFHHAAGIKIGGPVRCLQNTRLGFNSPLSFHLKISSRGIPFEAGCLLCYYQGMNFLHNLWNRSTKCDSGHYLNPLMHLFLLINAVFAIAFVFFPGTETVQASLLFTASAKVFGIDQFGLATLVAMVAHTLAFWFRGKVALVLMPIAMAAGFFAWLYASILYIGAGLLFQFAVACLPCLGFWAWYSIQFNRRRRGEFTAFVH